MVFWPIFELGLVFFFLLSCNSSIYSACKSFVGYMCHEDFLTTGRIFPCLFIFLIISSISICAPFQVHFSVKCGLRIEVRIKVYLFSP